MWAAVYEIRNKVFLDKAIRTVAIHSRKPIAVAVRSAPLYVLYVLQTITLVATKLGAYNKYLRGTLLKYITSKNMNTTVVSRPIFIGSKQNISA